MTGHITYFPGFTDCMMQSNRPTFHGMYSTSTSWSDSGDHTLKHGPKHPVVARLWSPEHQNQPITEQHEREGNICHPIVYDRHQVEVNPAHW